VTRNEATLLILLVLAAALAMFTICGFEFHHLTHELGQGLDPSRFGQ
jgi:hypothetical protein